MVPILGFPTFRIHTLWHATNVNPMNRMKMLLNLLNL